MTKSGILPQTRDRGLIIVGSETFRQFEAVHGKNRTKKEGTASCVNPFSMKIRFKNDA